LSGSPKLSKSWKSDAASFSILYTILFIIKTSDADVIYFDKQMTNTSELWVQMGNVSSVNDGRRVLPGAHALSGCNTTSSFFGNGWHVSIKVDWMQRIIDSSPFVFHWWRYRWFCQTGSMPNFGLEWSTKNMLTKRRFWRW
jgi:hypothetical protein